MAWARRETRYESIYKTKRSPLPARHAETPDAEDYRLFRTVSRGYRRSRRLYSQVKIPVLRDHRRQDISRSRIDRPHRPGVGPVRGAALEQFGERAFVDEAGAERAGRPRGFPHQNLRARRFSRSREIGPHRPPRPLPRGEQAPVHGLSSRDHARDGANRGESRKREFGEVVSAYESALLRLLAHPPARASWVNALAHAMGHFREKPVEKKRVGFLATLEEYRAGKFR